MHDVIHQAYMDDEIDGDPHGAAAGRRRSSVTQIGEEDAGLDPFMSDPRLVL